jgi:hypothetical protein
MSRHLITTEGFLPEVWVGWDPPLGTYFADVIDTDPTGEDTIVASVGNTPGEVTTVGTLAIIVGPYAEFTGDIARRLVSDRLGDQ